MCPHHVPPITTLLPLFTLKTVLVAPGSAQSMALCFIDQKQKSGIYADENHTPTISPHHYKQPRHIVINYYNCAALPSISWFI